MERPGGGPAAVPEAVASPGLSRPRSCPVPRAVPSPELSPSGRPCPGWPHGAASPQPEHRHGSVDPRCLWVAGLPSRGKAGQAGPSSHEGCRWFLNCSEIPSDSSLFFRYFTDPVVPARVVAVAVVRALSARGRVWFQEALGRLGFSVCVVSAAPELKELWGNFHFPSQHGLSWCSPTTPQFPSLGMCTARSQISHRNSLYNTSSEWRHVEERHDNRLKN